jgi:hypothetical protein
MLLDTGGSSDGSGRFRLRRLVLARRLSVQPKSTSAGGPVAGAFVVAAAGVVVEEGGDGRLEFASEDVVSGRMRVLRV